jgi:Trypsin-co-occurring domain 1
LRQWVRIEGGPVSQPIEFELARGGFVLIEVDEDAPEPGVVKATRTGDITTRAIYTFEDALDKVRPAVELLLERMRTLASTPEAIDIEFGIKFGLQAGAVISKASGEANFKVVVRWRRTIE